MNVLPSPRRREERPAFSIGLYVAFAIEVARTASNRFICNHLKHRNILFYICLIRLGTCTTVQAPGSQYVLILMCVSTYPCVIVLIVIVLFVANP